jgi:spectinomycin phosphotransferase
VGEPPGISPATLVASVQEHYAIQLASISWIDSGADAQAWVAQGRGVDGRDYVLKLRAGPPASASVQLTRYLQDHGLAQVVAPLATPGQRLWVGVGEYMLIVYPFIAGRSGADGGLTPAQWGAFGRLIKQLHSLALPPELAALISAESWTTDFSAQVAALTAAVEQADLSDEVIRDFAAGWREQQATIAGLARRAEELAGALGRTPAPLVLCHADMHTWNVLIDGQDQLWIIDWDTAMFGRRERDLMFVVEGISHDLISPQATAGFFAGYGPATLDPLALAYYRHAWAVQDCVAFGEEILRTGPGAATKQRALRLFSALFKPGQIAAIALGSTGAELRLA